MRAKIRKGDTVEIISGRLEDKGKRGEVIKVLPEEGTVVVQGLNIHKKHKSQVQTQSRSFTPGIIEFEAPLHISNVMLVCPKCNKPVRVGIQRSEGEIHRICRNCDSVID